MSARLREQVQTALNDAVAAAATTPQDIRLNLPSDGSVEDRLNVLEHLVVALSNELLRVAGKP
jgi:hypothetical protein